MDLLGLAEVAEMLRLTTQGVANRRARDPGFPKPVAELRSGPVWLKSDILAWMSLNDARTIDLNELEGVIAAAKAVAKRYRAVTGRPLGITGEIAEYEAARLLNLRLAQVRQDGHDATRDSNGAPRKIQVKGRCLLDGGKRRQQVGAIKLDKDWDSVLLVLLDEQFEPLEIYEADRPEVTAALEEPGSTARNERGALAVSKFKSIGRRVWSNADEPPASRNPREPTHATPTRGSGRTHVKRSEAMILAGYFLARCGSGEDRTGPPAMLRTSRWEEVYPQFYGCLGEGRAPAAFRNSLQNTRDDFDFYVDNGREGWDKPLSQVEQAVFDRWQNRTCAEIWAEVSKHVAPAS